MAKKLYYAVKQGHKTGIFKTWDECKKQVDGYSGAIYKGFATLQQAREFLGISAEEGNGSKEEFEQQAEVVAYVDGSYDDSVKEFSYGIVMFHDDIEDHFAEKFNTHNLVEMRNVAGEIKGAEKVMQYCIDNNVKRVDIYYDYEGIEKWCTGDWKTNKLGTKAYKAFYDNIKDRVKVRFIKVAGHSGDKYNDMADQLAKSALGIGSCPDVLERMNSMTASNIKFDDLVSIIDLLKEDIADLDIKDCLVPYGKGFVLSTKTPNKQKLKVIHFGSKNKIWLQGKKEDLFNQLSLYIVELLEKDEVPKFLNTVYNINMDKDVVEMQFEKYFPNSKGKWPSKVDEYLHQAVYNLQLNGNMYNFNGFVEPAIRPLEAVLKIALLDNNIPIRDVDKNYDSFFVFSKDRGIYRLEKEYIKEEHSKKLLDYLSLCYTHFSNYRHTLAHWDNPKSPIDTTRVIKTVTEAHTLIKDTIKIIDDYYKL